MNPTPDRVFMKDLKLMDKRLGCKFNGKHFVVTYDRGYGDPVNITRIKGGDEGFRQPDKRDLEFIKSGDMESDSVRRKLDRISHYAAEKERMKQAKKAKENIRDMTKDNKLQLKRWILDKSGSGKAHEFRRVTPKTKGKIF